MVYLLAGCALLIVLLLAARFLVRANPRSLAQNLRKVGGVALFAVAGFLALRGALPAAYLRPLLRFRACPAALRFARRAALSFAEICGRAGAWAPGGPN